MESPGNPHAAVLVSLLSRILEPILRGLEYLIAALATALIGVTFLQVILRYVFNTSFFGAEELARFLLTWFVFLSGTLGLDRGIHFTMDVLVLRLPRNVQRALRVVVQCCILAILSVLVVKGTDLAVRNWYQVSTAMQVPLTLSYAAIPLSSLLMFLITLRLLLAPTPRQTEMP
jgi:TRAP-type C4-dicarboxylate transport system permease small subunit